MTTRQEIDYVLGRWGEKPENELPRKYMHPKNEHDFEIGVALTLRRMRPADWGNVVRPTYSEHDELTGWRGLKFRDERRYCFGGMSTVERFIRETVVFPIDEV